MAVSIKCRLQNAECRPQETQVQSESRGWYVVCGPEESRCSFWSCAYNVLSLFKAFFWTILLDIHFYNALEYSYCLFEVQKFLRGQSSSDSEPKLFTCSYTALSHSSYSVCTLHLVCTLGLHLILTVQEDLIHTASCQLNILRHSSSRELELQLHGRSCATTSLNDRVLPKSSSVSLIKWLKSISFRSTW